MTITNGYATLDMLKARLLEMRRYTSTTISFTASTDSIADTNKGMRGVATGDVIEIEGSTSNDGFYTVESMNSPDSFVVEADLTDEAAGESVTIRLAGNVFEDTTLEQAIEACSRWIDEITQRRFYAATETRYYTPSVYDWLAVDDLLSITTLKTDTSGDRTYDTTWATTDYDLLPLNASLEALPYTMLEITPQGSNSFSALRKSVEIAGSFGYSATTPPQIREACLLLSARLFKRKDAVFGIAGTPDLGELRNIRPEDADAMAMLRPFRRIM
jgi:hypothetical protein